MGEEVDPGRDVYPVRDTNSSGRPARSMMQTPHNYNNHNVSSIDVEASRAAMASTSQERRMVTRWTREELEDRYFGAYEENIVLKKHARKQEDRIKRISTKLLRLMSDRKKQEHNDKGHATSARKRDIETEQIIEEQQDRIRESERQNKLLQEKLIVVRQQLETQLKRPIPAGYRHVSSRVDTGLPRYSAKPANASDHATGRINQATYSTFTVDRNEATINDVDPIASPLREQLDAYEQEIADLRDQMADRQSQHDNEIRTIKSQLTRDQRQTLRENVSVIRLQRELKQKSSQLLALEARCVETEQSLRTSRKEYEQLMSSADTLGHQLQEEQEKNTFLQSEVVSLATSNMIVAECKEKISDLEKENSILRESNSKLIDSALDYEKFNQKFAAETARRQAEARNQQERATQPMRSVISNDSSRDELIREREIRQKLQEELDQLRKSYTKLEEQHKELKKQFEDINKTKNDAANLIDFEEGLESEARRRRDQILEDQQLYRRFNEDNSAESLKKTLTEVQADHAETISELEKTRNMLVVQHRINKDSEAEVEVLSRKVVKIQQDYDDRLAEQGRLLELRAIRIQRLEHQLNDISFSERKSSQPEVKVQEPSVPITIVTREPEAVQATLTPVPVQRPQSGVPHMALPEESARDQQPKNFDSPKPTIPTPKPRRYSTSTPKGTSVLNESDVSVTSLAAKRPPIAPRENLKSTGDKLEINKPSPDIKPFPKMSSFSDSSLDEDDDDDDDGVVVSTPQTKIVNAATATMELDSEDDDDDDDDDDEDETESETDSDIVVAPETSQAADNSVVIVVSHLSFTPNAAVLNDDNIRMLFVEYRFLNFSAEELETPFALPKPTAANQRIVYNFRKSFRLDLAENQRSLQLFTDMVRSSPKDHKRITFTVVNEPPEDDEEAECEDVGHAHLDLGKIVTRKKDIVDEDIEIFDANNSRLVIGHLGVTVQALSAISNLIFQRPTA